MFNILYWIIFGAVIGFVADLIDKKHTGGLLTNIIIGILGTVVGGWIAGFVGTLLDFKVREGFNILNIAFAVIGALLVLFIYKAFTRRN